MEERFTVLTGAEPIFIKGSQVGILISHGFGGTPQSVRYLSEYIAAKGYTVYAPRLKGHGTHFHDMEKCTYNDWFQSLEDGYHFLQKHCDVIFVIGQSMGGTLTLNLASKYQDIQGVVIINAAMTTIPDMERFEHTQEPRFIEEGSPDIKAKSVYEITYTKTPLKSIQQLLALMGQTQGKLQKVISPTLAFQSLEDHVVPSKNTDFILKHIQSDIIENIYLYNSYHVATMDNEKKFIAENCCLFFEKHSNDTSYMKSL